MRKSKKRKQITAIMLAAGMAVAGSAPAFASSAGTVKVEVPAGTEAAESLGTPTKTTINGTINVTTVNVTVPLTAAFDIDPNKYDGNVGTQITTQSSDYKIVNNSASPIWVYVSAVEAEDVSLVDSISALDTSKTMMLAIKEKSTVTTNAATTKDFWMTTAVDNNTKKYVLDPDSAANKGQIAAKSGSTPGEMELYLYALTKTGWSHEDKFTIKPSFMITVSDPTL